VKDFCKIFVLRKSKVQMKFMIRGRGFFTRLLGSFQPHFIITRANTIPMAVATKRLRCFSKKRIHRKWIPINNTTDMKMRSALLVGMGR
jgi:hypothetical protein